VMRAVAGLIEQGLIRSAHDCSEGGLAVALAEMLFAGNLGATIDLAGVPCAEDADADHILMFAETPTRFVVEIEPQNFDAIAKALQKAAVRFGVIGTVTEEQRMKVRSIKAGHLMDEPIEDLRKSWLGTLDW